MSAAQQHAGTHTQVRFKPRVPSLCRRHVLCCQSHPVVCCCPAALGCTAQKQRLGDQHGMHGGIQAWLLHTCSSNCNSMLTVGLVGLDEVLQVLCRSKGGVGLVEIRGPVAYRARQQPAHSNMSSRAGVVEPHTASDWRGWCHDISMPCICAVTTCGGCCCVGPRHLLPAVPRD